MAFNIDTNYIVFRKLLKNKIFIYHKWVLNIL